MSTRRSGITPRRHVVKRYALIAALSVLLLGAACGAATDNVTAGPASNTVAPTDAPTHSSTEPSAEPSAMPLPPEPELASGRTALAAAQGGPHVLWFWGAH